MLTRLNFKQAQFLTSAPTIKECPPEKGAEVAFAGRSNAGKSSAINCLTDNAKLARTSKTPGRTQLINYFSLTETQRLVDLPGYGYAKVAKAVKLKWQKHLTEYLYERKCLTGLILLMDIRHPMQEFDTTMINGALEAERPVHILLTKCDKLSRSQAKNTLFKVSDHLQQAGADDLISAQIFSALKGEGLPELTSVLKQWLQVEPEESTQMEDDSTT